MRYFYERSITAILFCESDEKGEILSKANVFRDKYTQYES